MKEKGCSKTLVCTNKLKELNNTILGLQNEECIFQQKQKKNGRNHIKLTQTTPRKATNEYGKE